MIFGSFKGCFQVLNKYRFQQVIEGTEFKGLQCILLVRCDEDDLKKDIANFIVGAPTMILQNGFGQTMAFLLSKCKGKTEKKDKHFFTFTTIARWSERINEKVPFEISGFFEAVSSLEQNDYLKLQEEALKMLQWLKRYARAFQEE